MPTEISKAIEAHELVVAGVLSGNRNFEGRIHPEVRANYLASPPLVVAYALAGRVDIDLYKEPLGTDTQGKPVMLADIWPTQAEVTAAIEKGMHSGMFRKVYGEVFKGDERWNALAIPHGDLYQWDPRSTYVKNPPYFDGMTMLPPPVDRHQGARGSCLSSATASPPTTFPPQGPSSPPARPAST